MRRILHTTAVLLTGAILLTGCGPDVPRAGGLAAPVGVASSSVPPVPVTVAPSRVVPSSVPPSSPVSRAPRRPAVVAGNARLLGPDGYGKLKLGMTTAEATKTGLVTTWRRSPMPGPRDEPDNEARNCRVTALRGVPSGAPAGAGDVYAGPFDDGVVAIYAYGSMRTPEGVRLGMAWRDVLKVYPKVKPDLDDMTDRAGWGVVDVPGNSQAQYHLYWSEGVLRGLILQDKAVPCYS